MQIFDTLSGKKEELPKTGSKPLRLFVCGPTVYDYLHIGNARNYIVFDTFAKYLRSQGKKVFFLENITDIDDKIIARAAKEGTTPHALAQKYTALFQKDMRDLRITSVTKYARATRFVPEIIAQINRLIEKGHAYRIEGDGWYFDLATFPDYGKLAKRTIEQAEDGVSRIDVNDEKRNRGDFCLWKFSKANEPVWKAPFGNGRPGWHIEDTAISEHFFGPQYDMHGAGRDLIFPHHEAEIAEQESASGKKPFVKIWMHVGLVSRDGKKMSKSLGNVVTIDDFLSQHGANTLRLIALQHHYRSPVDYTETLLAQATAAIKGLAEFSLKLDLAIKKNPLGTHAAVSITPYEKHFTGAMDDDLNTPQAIATIFKLTNPSQTAIWQISRTQARDIKEWLSEKLDILGIKFASPKIPLKIKALVAQRELSRSNKQFAHSDALRKKIEQLGYKIEDTPVGPLILPSQISNHKSQN